jgi:hypothetical protein
MASPHKEVTVKARIYRLAGALATLGVFIEVLGAGRKL